MPIPLRFVPNAAKLWKDSGGHPIAIAEMTIRIIRRGEFGCGLFGWA